MVPCRLVSTIHLVASGKDLVVLNTAVEPGFTSDGDISVGGLGKTFELRLLPFG
jgi:hypothetical protein